MSQKRFRVMTCDKKKHHCHPVLPSYVKNISEIKDLLFLKNRVLIESPCPSCIVRMEKLNSTVDYPKQNLTEALTTIRTLQQNSIYSTRRKRADNLYMHLSALVFIKSPTSEFKAKLNSTQFSHLNQWTLFILKL